MSQQYDLVVIGTGPGGYVAAIRAAQLGLKVAAIEKEKTGGVCLNWGCIPTKSLIESAHLLDKMKKAESFGLKADNVSHDFTAIIKRSRQIANRLEKGIGFLFKKNKVDLIAGTAEVTGLGQIKVTNSEGSINVVAKNIILATGARAKNIPGIEPNGDTIITSREAIQLAQQPKHLAILGAGAIGMEMAYFYSRLGTKITLFEMEETVLPQGDKEVSQALEAIYKKEAWTILTSCRVQKVEVKNQQVLVSYKTKDGQEGSVTADKLLSAVGMRGNGDSLGSFVPFDAKTGFIKVNERYETGLKGIYAIGDLIGPPLLAHVASAEGIIAAEIIAGKNPPLLNYAKIPACVYTEPQVATVGLTEDQARQQYSSIKVGRFPFQASGRALASGETAGFVKVILDGQYGEILGTHMIGAGVTELIAEPTLAMTLEGTGEALHRTVHSHPTLSEAVMEAIANAENCAIHI